MASFGWRQAWTAANRSKSRCWAGSTRSRQRVGRLRRRRRRAAGRSLHHLALPAGARGVGLGRPRHRLDAAAPRRPRRRPRDRGDAALRQEPQPGRVHLRPQLGACLGARRRRLLPQAAGGGAVHAGDRPALPDPRRASRRGPRGACCRGRWRWRGRWTCPSLHVTFCTEAERDWGEDVGLLARTTQQFHWQNRGYADFDAFLADLASRKRKAIRRERERAQAFGGDIVALTGDALEREHWDAFWRFYQDTGSRKWGRPVPDPRLLRPGAGDACATTCCWCWRAGAAAGSPGR